MIWIDKSRWARNFSNPIYFPGAYVPPLVLMPPVLNNTPNRAITESMVDVIDTRRERPVNRRHPMALKIPAVANPQLALRLVMKEDSVHSKSHFRSISCIYCQSPLRSACSKRWKMWQCVPNPRNSRRRFLSVEHHSKGRI